MDPFHRIDGRLHAEPVPLADIGRAAGTVDSMAAGTVDPTPASAPTPD